MLSSFSSSFSFGKMTKVFPSPYQNAVLVIDLDGENYSGFGSEWTDASRYKNDAFAVNHVPRHTANSQFYFTLEGSLILDEFVPSEFEIPADGGGGDVIDANTTPANTAPSNTVIDASEHFVVQDDRSLDIEQEITFEMWYRIDTLQGADPTVLFSKISEVEANTYIGYYGYVDSSGYTFSFGNSANNQVLEYAASPTIDAWQHLVVSISNVGSSVYVNGTEVANSSYTSTSTSSNDSNLMIGSAVYGTLGASISDMYSFDGDLAAFRIYDGTLTAAEVLSNFNEKKSRFGL
jgi:hypothetical protein